MYSNRFFSVIPVITALILLGFNGSGHASSLEPSNPPGPTFRTLGEIEPRQPIRANTEVIEPIIIDQPGSYFLVEDVYAIPDNNAITISANDVTLDLKGFTVHGNLEVTDGFGIQVTGNNVTIHDGTVKNADQSGIGCLGKLLKLFNVNSTNNAIHGVHCSDAHIVNGDFYENGQNGITGSSLNIEGVRASENGDKGISLGGRSLVTRSLAHGNGTYGIICTQGVSLAIQLIAVGNTDGNNFGCTIYDSYATDPP